MDLMWKVRQTAERAPGTRQGRRAELSVRRFSNRCNLVAIVIPGSPPLPPFALISDLSKHLVQNYSDVEELMEAGNINRTTASTGMNDVSSRSHAIFTINFTQVRDDSRG